MSSTTLISYLVHSLTVAVIVIVLCACSGNSSVTPQPQNASSASANNGGSSPISAEVQHALNQWRANQRQEAVQTILTAAEAGKPLRAFDFNEYQFVNQPQAQRDVLSAQLLDTAEALRALGRAIIEAGRSAAQSGDHAQAHRLFSVAYALGIANTGGPSQIVTIGNLAGKEISSAAQKELDALPESAAQLESAAQPMTQ